MLFENQCITKFQKYASDLLIHIYIYVQLNWTQLFENVLFEFILIILILYSEQ